MHQGHPTRRPAPLGQAGRRQDQGRLHRVQPGWGQGSDEGGQHRAGQGILMAEIPGDAVWFYPEDFDKMLKDWLWSQEGVRYARDAMDYSFGREVIPNATP